MPHRPPLSTSPSWEETTDPDAAPTRVGARHESPYAIEPGLLAAPPRPVRWSVRAAKARRWCYGGYAGALLLFLAFACYDLATYDALLARGVPATATITSKNTLTLKSTGYYLHYSFKSDNGTTTGMKQVGSRGFDGVSVGSTFPITYLPGSHG